MSIIIKRASSFSIIFSLVAFIACSESSDEGINESIIGTWNWYQTSGGFAGIIDTPETTGETRKIVFQDNGNVTFYTNDEVTLSSTYTLANEITVISEEPLPVVKVEGVDLFYIYSFPYVDELELQESVIDGFIHNYTKG